jgi:hypothetical protein
MLGLFYCFLSSGIFIKEIRYLYIVSIKNNILLRFQIILFPKTNLRRKQMAKSDLLKEAIADAKAVKETALANAKIALQEAFTPRIKSMLETELIGELEDDEMAMDEPMDDMGDEMAMDEPMGDMGDEMGAEGEPMDVGDIEIDTDMDGEIDFTGDIMSKPGMDAEPEMDEPMGDLEGDAAMGDDMGDDLGIEEIIKELEEDLESEGMENEMYVSDGEEEEDLVTAQMRNEMDDPKAHTDGIELSESIDDLIEAILAEEDEDENPKEGRGDKKKNEEMKDKKDETNEDRCITKNEELKETLGEAYDTVSHLKSVINEVNLLNAKLLYTNKLFRNFDLNEGQKMKVIENFDRAGNTREAKLVFATLAESFHKPTAGKRIVKESRSMASKPVASTAPSKETTQVLTEGFEQANRWKKLAGLIK